MDVNMNYLLVFLSATLLLSVQTNDHRYLHKDLLSTHHASTCSELSCNNGHCEETVQGPICICDEGFNGTYCNEQGPDFYHRTELMPNLADPNILAMSDDLFILMGTGNTLTLPIYQSTDLIYFQLNTTYNPSAVDPVYDYCSLWAPNIIKNGSDLNLHFVAQRVMKNASCPARGQDVTTFLAKAPNNTLSFGAPELVDFGDGAPRGRIAAGCNDDSCSKTVRIDPDVTGPDSDRWFFYVWFLKGNNIASFPFHAPENVTINTGPAVFPTPPGEENINEAPEVFWRNGYYYLFFSTAGFNSQYAMSYIMASTVADLTRNRVARMHSMPVRNSAGILVQTHGSNTIVARRGQFFNVFHQGIFDGTGYLITRDTFKQRLAFRSDGSLQSLNVIDIRWTQLVGYQYSLDILKNDGTWLGPCLGANRIGNSLGTTYMGICLDRGDQLVDKSDILAFRLYYSNTTTWIDYVEVPYDGVSDQMAIYLPGGTTEEILLRWNERITGTQYSLDILRSDGTWIAPCVGAAFLRHNIEYLYDGHCKSASLFVEPRNMTSIRVCSAIDGDWSKAICGTVPYDGKIIHVYVTI